MSPDGKNLVVVVQGDLLVYDLSGEFVKHTIIKPPCNRADFFIADWIPQSEIIVFGITDGKITYNASIYGFDATTGKCLGILSASDGWGVPFLKGNPSGDLLSASIGGGIKVLDINTKKEVASFPERRRYSNHRERLWWWMTREQENYQVGMSKPVK